MTLVIVTGGIDLSVGSVLALSAAVFGLVLTGPANSLALAAVASVLTGAAADSSTAPSASDGSCRRFGDARDAGDGARRDVSPDGLAHHVSRGAWTSSAATCCLALRSGGSRHPRDCWAVHAHTHGLRPRTARRRLEHRGGAARGHQSRVCASRRSGWLARSRDLAAIVQAGRLASSIPTQAPGSSSTRLRPSGLAARASAAGAAPSSRLRLARVILVLGAGWRSSASRATRRLVTGGVIVAAAIVDHYRAKGGRSR